MHHLLLIVVHQWAHGHYRHWQHWTTALRYIRRLAPHAGHGYARQFLHFVVQHRIGPRKWAGWNQA